MSLSAISPDMPRESQARFAGLLYLVIILCGVTSEAILRAPLHGSLSALGEGIPALRASLLLDMVMASCDVALALAFYNLLKGVDAPLALAAMVFRLMQAATIAASLVLLAMVPALVFADSDLALPLMTAHATGYDIGLIFFGFSSVFMARLLYLSGGVPIVISAGLMLAGLVYLTGSTLRLCFPDLLPAFQPAYLICLLAEGALCLWLIFTGRI